NASLQSCLHEKRCLVPIRSMLLSGVRDSVLNPTITADTSDWYCIMSSLDNLWCINNLCTKSGFIVYVLLLLRCCVHRYLNQALRIVHLHLAATPRGRLARRHPGIPHGVELLEIIHGLEPDLRAQNARLARARLLEQRIDLVQHLPGLFLDARGTVVRDLPRQIDDPVMDQSPAAPRALINTCDVIH